MYYAGTSYLTGVLQHVITHVGKEHGHKHTAGIFIRSPNRVVSMRGRRRAPPLLDLPPAPPTTRVSQLRRQRGGVIPRWLCLLLGDEPAGHAHTLLSLARAPMNECKETAGRLQPRMTLFANANRVTWGWTSRPHPQSSCTHRSPCKCKEKAGRLHPWATLLANANKVTLRSPSTHQSFQTPASARRERWGEMGWRHTPVHLAAAPPGRNSCLRSWSPMAWNKSVGKSSHITKESKLCMVFGNKASLGLPLWKTSSYQKLFAWRNPPLRKVNFLISISKAIAMNRHYFNKCFNKSSLTHSLPQSKRAVMCRLTSFILSWVRWPTSTWRRRSRISFIMCHSRWKRSPSFLCQTHNQILRPPKSLSRVQFFSARSSLSSVKILLSLPPLPLPPQLSRGKQTLLANRI